MTHRIVFIILFYFLFYFICFFQSMLSQAVHNTLFGLQRIIGVCLFGKGAVGQIYCLVSYRNPSWFEQRLCFWPDFFKDPWNFAQYLASVVFLDRCGGDRGCGGCDGIGQPLHRGRAPHSQKSYNLLSLFHEPGRANFVSQRHQSNQLLIFKQIIFGMRIIETNRGKYWK